MLPLYEYNFINYIVNKLTYLKYTLINYYKICIYNYLYITK